MPPLRRVLVLVLVLHRLLLGELKWRGLRVDVECAADSFSAGFIPPHLRADLDVAPRLSSSVAVAVAAPAAALHLWLFVLLASWEHHSH